MKKYEEKYFRKETHLHFYIEGYGEKWAFPLEEFTELEIDGLEKQLESFIVYCDVVDIPKFEKGGLFWKE